MTTLYIIGNGFDLWHDLPTSYRLFCEFAKDTLDELENYCNINTLVDCPWYDFENSLGTFDWEVFYSEHDHTDIFSDDFKPSEAFCLEDDLSEQTENIVEAIREQFHDWVSGIDISSIAPKMRFEDNALFINFNYTSTLQTVYGIADANVKHIHGRSDAYDDLVFGHCETIDEEPEFDEYGESNRTMFSDAQGAAKFPFYAFQKPVNEIIEKNNEFFEGLRHIKKIFVIGHSLNKIDLPYFKQIALKSNGAIWMVCCYREEDKIEHILKLKSCGIEQSKIHICTYADLATNA